MTRAPTEDELRDELVNAPEAPPTPDDPPKPPKEPGDKSTGQGGGAGRRGRKRGEIFDNCPVTPLGVHGDFCFYLDTLGQLRAVKKHEAQTIQSLFGHQIPKLCYKFPKWEKTEGGGFERVPYRFDQTTASMAMYEAVTECGVFNPDNAVRGVGAWTDDDGNLVYHMGDTVMIGSATRKPGRHGNRIYPAAPPIPHPAPDDSGVDPVPDIIETLQSWNWTQPDVHPFLCLGMIGVQMLCGALDWRPVFWLLAAAGSGKSEFQRLVKLLHGDDGLIQSNDATKSGITSRLKQSSLPVALDELEPGDERSTKEREIIRLARVAASGGEWWRGSADQSGVGGKIYSAFMFSSILMPGVMTTADVQRLIRLELNPLDKSAVKLSLVPKTWRARGARLKRLLIDRWPTWQDRLAVWRQALELTGVTGRDADNWGTVLAMADMAQNAELPTADVAGNWARKVSFAANADREDTLNDSEEMLLHLMAQPFDIYRRGELHTVAQWVMAAALLPGAPPNLVDTAGQPTERERQSQANSKLAKIGLRVSGFKDEAQLFIANKPIHGLNEMFRNSDWHGGGWKTSARRVPGAEATPNPLRLAGIASRGTLMPVRSIPGLTEFPMDRDDSVAPHVEREPGSDIDEWG